MSASERRRRDHAEARREPARRPCVRAPSTAASASSRISFTSSSRCSERRHVDALHLRVDLASRRIRRP